MCCVCCQGETMPITRAAGHRPLIIGLAALPPRQWKNACEQQNTPGCKVRGARCQLRFASRVSSSRGFRKTLAEELDEEVAAAATFRASLT